MDLTWDQRNKQMNGHLRSPPLPLCNFLSVIFHLLYIAVFSLPCCTFHPASWSQCFVFNPLPLFIWTFSSIHLFSLYPLITRVTKTCLNVHSPPFILFVLLRFCLFFHNTINHSKHFFLVIILVLPDLVVHLNGKVIPDFRLSLCVWMFVWNVKWPISIHVSCVSSSSPLLSWRDVQHIIVKTSRAGHLSAPDWKTNAAGYNGTHASFLVFTAVQTPANQYKVFFYHYFPATWFKLIWINFPHVNFLESHLLFIPLEKQFIKQRCKNVRLYNKTSQNIIVLMVFFLGEGNTNCHNNE